MWKVNFSKARPILILLVLSACSFGRQSPAPVQNYGTQSGAGTTGAITVLKGDNLYKISERYNIAMRDVAALNNLSAPFYLEPGSRIKLPPPREYMARPGDTLYTVSRLFGVSTSELVSLNNLQAPYSIYPRQTIRLPSLTNGPNGLTKDDSVEVVAALGENAPIEAEKLEDPTIKKEPLKEQPQKEPALTQVQKQKQIAEKQQPASREKITARTPKRSSSKFESPVEGNIVSGYGPKNNGLHNDGINIAAPRGTPVRSAENGVVVYVGNDLKGSGNLVLVRHDDGWMSAYAHLDKTMIKRGEVINRGQEIGTVGNTGFVDSPQLHFELRRGTKALNPQVYLAG